MLITLKDKDTLTFKEFIFKCSTGESGIKIKKIEGDKSTPKGIFSIGTLYYRADRVEKPVTKISTKNIKKNMAWCDDPKSKYYNKEIKINNMIGHEKLYRKDNSYDYFIVINYNTKPVTRYKGSAIFIHLTENYKKTSGCIALKKSDFLVLANIINKKTNIKIV
jgi:L,D-peptidoglycan transpeptidase YkuD (ErfK/YbiS/YcfS/YnhG family)